ncbi:MAG: hypothetical protein KJZ93_16590 [Caldilineaceae bacterium]|nr:hypothetical protein [Caldilineaceae bacterium]
MPHTPRSPSTILFTVRLWPEEIDASHFEWRGEVKKITNGQTYYFRDWATLVQLIVKMLEAETSLSSTYTKKEPQ